MSILDNVLQYAVPVEWDYPVRSNYESVRYRLYDLRPGNAEYSREVNAFVNGEPRLEVTQLQRVQNPYQLGRFVLRKEQKLYRNEIVEVVKYYHPMKAIDLEIALEHNMDIRRYTSKQSGQCANQNPQFYQTPGRAFNSIISCDLIIVCNVLGRSSEGSTTSKSNDTEYMPTYVARVASMN